MLAPTIYGWKNKRGTSNRETCNCGSWKNHWLNYSGSSYWPTYCSVYGCYDHATDGGHVINDYYNGEWIIPLCKTHNNPNNTATFTIKNGTYIASANRGNTCGY